MSMHLCSGSQFSINVCIQYVIQLTILDIVAFSFPQIVQVDPQAPVHKLKVEFVRDKGSYFSYPDAEDVD